MVTENSHSAVRSVIREDLLRDVIISCNNQDEGGFKSFKEFRNKIPAINNETAKLFGYQQIINQVHRHGQEKRDSRLVSSLSCCWRVMDAL